MKTSTTLRLPLIAKIAIAMTFINTWVIFEETVVDRHGLWRYMPFYRVGSFCVWDAAVLAVTLLLLLVSVAPLRRRSGPTLSTTLPIPLIAKVHRPRIHDRSCRSPHPDGIQAQESSGARQ